MLHERLHTLGVVALALLIAWYIRRYLRLSRLSKLGARPPLASYYLPFGFDTLWQAIAVT